MCTDTRIYAQSTANPPAQFRQYTNMCHDADVRTKFTIRHCRSRGHPKLGCSSLDGDKYVGTDIHLENGICLVP